MLLETVTQNFFLCGGWFIFSPQQKPVMEGFGSDYRWLRRAHRRVLRSYSKIRCDWLFLPHSLVISFHPGMFAQERGILFCFHFSKHEHNWIISIVNSFIAIPEHYYPNSDPRNHISLEPYCPLQHCESEHFYSAAWEKNRAKEGAGIQVT